MTMINIAILVLCLKAIYALYADVQAWSDWENFMVQVNKLPRSFFGWVVVILDLPVFVAACYVLSWLWWVQ